VGEVLFRCSGCCSVVDYAGVHRRSMERREIRGELGRRAA
jgi:hypothetical protein